MRFKEIAPPVRTFYRRLYQDRFDCASLAHSYVHGTARADQRGATPLMVWRTGIGGLGSCSLTQGNNKGLLERQSKHCGDGDKMSSPVSKVCHKGSGGQLTRLMRSRFSSSATDSGGPIPGDPSSVLKEEDFHNLAEDVLHHLQEKIEIGGDDLDVDGLDSVYAGSRRTYSSNRKSPERRHYGVTKEKLDLRRQIIGNLVSNILNLKDVNLVGQVLSDWIKAFACKRDLLAKLDAVSRNEGCRNQYSSSRFVPYTEVARIVHAVMQIVGEEGNLEGALEILRWMERQGWCKLDPHMYTTVIDALGEAGCLELAERIFSSLNLSEVEKDVALFNAMINARGKAGQIDSLEDLFESMKSSFCKPDLVTYNTVMNSYVKAGMGLGTVVSIFKDMYTQGIVPDIVSFNILLEACVSGRHVSEAQKIFENLKRRALKPTVVTYTTLIDVYCNSGRSSDALRLLSVMLAHDCLPNAITFSCLIAGCVRDGIFDEAEKLFQVMKDLEVESNVVTYNAMIDLYRKRGDFGSAKHLYEEMKVSGLQPTSVTAASLMAMYKGLEDYVEVFAMYEEAKQEAICNEHVFTEAIDACIKSGNMQRVADIQSEMAAINCPPDVVTCSVVLSALGSKCSSEDDACVLVDFLQAFESDLMVNSRRMLLELMTTDEEVQKSIHKLYTLLNKEDLKTWTIFSCALVDALWALGWYRRATLVVAWVMNKGLFEDICVIDSREWKLDLRRLSSGAALVALYQWLGHLVVVARHLESVKRKKLDKEQSVNSTIKRDFRQDGISDESVKYSQPQFPAQVEVLLPLLPLLVDLLPDNGSRATRRSENSAQYPPLVTVVTGWGKFSKEEGSSIVRDMVQKEILKLRAPFKRSADRGKWMARGESLIHWMMNPATAARLVLADLVPEAERTQ